MTIDRLPYDVLYFITESLDLDDIVHLSYTCRQLRACLSENTLCRRTVLEQFPHSTEAALARNGDITFCEAMQRVYDRRQSFSDACPFSAQVIGQCSDFVYRQGVICLLRDKVICIFDTRSRSGDQREIDIAPLLSTHEGSPSSPCCAEPKLSLLYYSDEIAAIHYERKGRPSKSEILAISTKREEEDVPVKDRLRKRIFPDISHKLFVRHTASFLYYGTYSGMGDYSHHEWEIKGVSLGGANFRETPIQLEEFFGTDIGSTVAFEIHDGYFYALSNQTSFDIEELDWTSFYHCVRFPLNNPVSEKMDINKKIYRRQHAEGPINDSWTELTLQADEATNKLMIVESRQEWQNGSSKQSRTFYIQDITFPAKSTSNTPLDGSASPETPMYPPDDPLGPLIDSSNNPNYAPEQKRSMRHTHPEFGGSGVPISNARAFTLFRTKFRAYNFSCSSFLDIVEDDTCCANSQNHQSGLCLRLRIGSRRLEPLFPASYCGSDKAPLTGIDGISEKPPSDEGRGYRYSPVRLWPPATSTCPCAARLHGILNPAMPPGHTHTKSITGFLDEKNLVYFVRPGKSYGSDADEKALGTVVLVNFTRQPENGLDVPDLVDASFSPPAWHWRPGHTLACRQRACR